METAIDEPPLRTAGRKGKWLQWLILAAVELLGGFTFSLLAPFFTKEAVDVHGLSVTQASWVYSTVFLTTLVATPLSGKLVGHVGARLTFIFGVTLAGAATVAFGALQWIQDPYTFLALSIFVRTVSAAGEAAFYAAAFVLAVKVLWGECNASSADTVRRIKI